MPETLTLADQSWMAKVREVLPELMPLGNDKLWLLLIATALSALFIGFCLTRFRWQRRRQSWREQQQRLIATLEAERSQHQQLNTHLNTAHQELRDSFESLAARALRDNNSSFLELAKQNLQGQQQQAQSALAQREQAISHMVTPINQALKKTEEQLQLLEKQRREAQGQLSEQLRNMASSQAELHNETRRLVGALKRPEVRGQWGELSLRRLVELAGMVEHCDFSEQTHSAATNTAGALRPDMIIRLPEQRSLVVDVKTPLDAYLKALEARDTAEQQQALDKHANNVQMRIKELSNKAYWERFDETPDFVILYIPGDQFLSAALEKKPQLLEEALQQQIILATPTSLVALLRAVAYGWRQLSLAENVSEMRDMAASFYDRLATFSEHLARVGRQLSSSVEHYNKAVGSLEQNVLTSARRFTDLGLTVKKTIPELNRLNEQARTLQSVDLSATSTDSSGPTPEQPEKQAPPKQTT